MVLRAIFTTAVLLGAQCLADETKCLSLPENSDCLTRTIDKSLPLSEAAPLLVDIRSTDHFNQVRVNGALHIAPHILKTKEYLRERPIIILGEPSDYRTLRRLCAELSSAKFLRYEALLGGIATWARSATETFVGDKESLSGVLAITPMELLAERAGSPWLFVDVSPSAREGTLFEQPLRALPITPAQSSFVDLLRAMWPSDSTPQPTRIALLGDIGSLKPQTRRALQENFPPAIVFHVPGGVRALQEAKELQMKVVAASALPRTGDQCR